MERPSSWRWDTPNRGSPSRETGGRRRGLRSDTEFMASWRRHAATIGGALAVGALVFWHEDLPAPYDRYALVAIALTVAALVLGYCLLRATSRNLRRTLSASEAQYRELVEQLQLVVYVDELDPAALPVYASPQVVPLLGYSLEEW